MYRVYEHIQHSRLSPTPSLILSALGHSAETSLRTNGAGLLGTPGMLEKRGENYNGERHHAQEELWLDKGSHSWLQCGESLELTQQESCALQHLNT